MEVDCVVVFSVY